MALRTALLVMACVLAVRADHPEFENSPLGQKINSNINSVCDQLLGVPCKVSPPPPFSSTQSITPTPPAPEPSAEVPSPETLPTVPVPAPEPMGSGTATGLVQIITPAGVTLTAADYATITAIVQNAIGTAGTVTITPVTNGRKLLDDTTVSVAIEDVMDCPTLSNLLNAYIQGNFPADARARAVRIITASLTYLGCIGAGNTVSLTNPPAPLAPSPARR